MDSLKPGTDDELLLDLGLRLEAQRLRRAWSQAQLARESGVSKSTIERLEAGSGGQTRSLVRILRALGLLQGFDGLVPALDASPMEQLGNKRAARRRAPRLPAPPEPGHWVWGDER